MKINYTLTLADYKAALRLHSRQTFGRHLSFILIYIAVPILAILGLVIWPFLHITDQTPTWIIILMNGIEILLVYLSIAAPISRFLQIRKNFKRLFPSARTDRNSSIDIDDECILSGLPGVSEVKTFWPGIFGFAQDNQVTMIYLNRKAFLFFPTSALSPDQRIELNNIVTRHGLRKEK
jgi:hypothetical protein